MTTDDIARVVARVPTLTNFGIGVFDGLKPVSDGCDLERLKESQETLLGSAEACTEICRWLHGIKKTQSINNRRSSYGLKHLTEFDIERYVSNGQFIAAAIHSDFVFELCRPNVYFGISERSLSRRSRTFIR